MPRESQAPRRGLGGRHTAPKLGPILGLYSQGGILFLYLRASTLGKQVRECEERRGRRKERSNEALQIPRQLASLVTYTVLTSWTPYPLRLAALAAPPSSHSHSQQLLPSSRSLRSRRGRSAARPPTLLSTVCSRPSWADETRAVTLF